MAAAFFLMSSRARPEPALPFIVQFTAEEFKLPCEGIELALKPGDTVELIVKAVHVLPVKG